MSRKTIRKTRGYAGIIYPDSAPENFKELLSDLKMQALLSPLHDKDVNPDGEPKKPHYHVILVFDGPQTEKRAKELLAEVGAIDYVEPLNSLTGMARYLCHLDNPEKHQYDQSEVMEFGGISYLEMIDRVGDNLQVLVNIYDFIEERDIYSYRQLIQEIKDKREWFRVATQNNTLAISTYLRSRQWEKDQAEKKLLSQVCRVTGEIKEG